MAARTLPPFRADHVGSSLRTPALLDAQARHRAGGRESGHQGEQFRPSPRGGFFSAVEGKVAGEEPERAELRLAVEAAEEVWG
jgi:hypothetical protein